MKILLSGAGGQMGITLAGIIKNKEGMEVVAGVSDRPVKVDFTVYSSFKDVKEKADAVIDFSSPVVLEQLLDYCIKNNTPAVVCTTGYSKEQEQKIKDTSKNIPIVYSGNMSLGINVMEYVVEQMAKLLADFDIEIVEKHHNLKKDAPSGTAKMLFDSANKGRKNSLTRLDGRAGFYDNRDKNEVGISAIRGGNIVGEHTVIFAGDDEVLEITHRASSKKIFANGAIKAALFLQEKENGLYNMNDCLNM